VGSWGGAGGWGGRGDPAPWRNCRLSWGIYHTARTTTYPYLAPVLAPAHLRTSQDMARDMARTHTHTSSHTHTTHTAHYSTPHSAVSLLIDYYY
jgi:hypothetical protein